MSSIVVNTRSSQIVAIAIGTLVAACTSIYLFQRGRRKRSTDNDGTSTNNNNESDFYRQLGISEENLPSHIQRQIHKERQRKSKIELISMKSKMYDNICMLDQNRNPMCTISMKKAKWYVKKGIAEWSETSKEQFSDGGEVKCIRLLFEHSGSYEDKGESESLYLKSAKQNVCVCCGDNGHHIRHYIVPYAYRTQFPHEYKSHMSHDIVILCPDCHVDCERVTKRRMKQMEHDLRLQTGQCNESPVIEDAHKYHVRSAAIALVKWRDKMPDDKVSSHEKDVREYLASICKNEEETDAIFNGTEELTKQQLQTACSVNYRIKNPDFVTGSEVVVRSLKGDAKMIEEFIIDWRRHFIATVNPQHMPTGWRIENPVVCGRGKDDDSGADGGEKSW